MKMKLYCQTNPAKIKQRCGNYVTNGAYMTSELLVSAGTLQCTYISSIWDLTHIHYKLRCGTIATENSIGQLRGKTIQSQSLDTSLTYADIINKIKDLTFVTEALSEFSTSQNPRLLFADDSTLSPRTSLADLFSFCTRTFSLSFEFFLSSFLLTFFLSCPSSKSRY